MEETTDQSGAIEAETVTDEQMEIDEIRKEMEAAIGEDCILTGEQIAEWEGWLAKYPDLDSLREGKKTMTKMVEKANNTTTPKEEKSKSPAKATTLETLKQELLTLLEDNREGDIVTEEEYAEESAAIEKITTVTKLKGTIADWERTIDDRKKPLPNSDAQTSIEDS